MCAHLGCVKPLLQKNSVCFVFLKHIGQQSIGCLALFQIFLLSPVGFQVLIIFSHYTSVSCTELVTLRAFTNIAVFCRYHCDEPPNCDGKQYLETNINSRTPAEKLQSSQLNHSVNVLATWSERDFFLQWSRVTVQGHGLWRIFA